MKKHTTPIWIVGIDEVGRGPLAGPVTVCAVAMKVSDYRRAKWPGLTDSKKLSPQQREKWFAKAKEMEKKSLIRVVLAQKSAHLIDTKGIAVCIRSCIVTVLEKLKIDPKSSLVLLDGGLRAPTIYTNQQTIIRGDQKKKIISLASVVAKVSRDSYMDKIHSRYPQYVWNQNKGYGTKAHRTIIRKRGITLFHRKSFLINIIDKRSRIV